MNTIKRFEWNKDTLEYFRKHNKIDYDKQSEMRMFVENNSVLEDGESYEDLIKDLELQSKYE